MVPRSAQRFASQLTYIVFKRSYLKSISVNSLHGKLTDQKKSMQNSAIHKIGNTLIKSITLISFGNIAMTETCTLQIYKNCCNLDIWTTNHTKTVSKLNSLYSFCLQKWLSVLTTHLPAWTSVLSDDCYKKAMLPYQLVEVTDRTKMEFTSPTVWDSNKRIHSVLRNHYVCFF